MSKVAITGNTYPVREQLAALGGKWDAERKAWMVPMEHSGEARRIVAAAPKQNGFKRRGTGFNRGSSYGECNCRECRRGSESTCLRDWG